MPTRKAAYSDHGKCVAPEMFDSGLSEGILHPKQSS